MQVNEIRHGGFHKIIKLHVKIKILNRREKQEEKKVSFLLSLDFLQYPMGKRDGSNCDIYWHGASFYENPDLQCGRVNKFPGTNS